MPSPRYWRAIPSRLRLEAVRCRSCENVVYPSRRICPHCHGTEWEPSELSRSGVLALETAGQAVVLAAMANTSAKGSIVLVGGSNELRKVLLPGVALILVAGVASAFLF